MPVITEKATSITDLGQYCFEVSRSANKIQIKKAVEHIFGVKVKAVNTLILKGKKKLFKGRVGFRQDKKKAYITLDAGQKIDISAGV
jgi:large subunit ribosomal protein L23